MEAQEDVEEGEDVRRLAQEGGVLRQAVVQDPGVRGVRAYVWRCTAR